MSQLFDADEYSDGRKAKKETVRRPTTVAPAGFVLNEGTWISVTRKDKRPHDFAHWRREHKGGEVSACKLIGGVLELPLGARVLPCPKCLAIIDPKLVRKVHDV